MFTVVYPFVRDTYHGYDEEGGFERPTWKPGISNRPCGPEDYEPYADAEGKARFTVVAVFKPGRYPTRVFFTRKFIDPDGREFGKDRLHIATLEKFRRWATGWRVPYGLGEEHAPRRHNLADSRNLFEELLAEAASA